MALKFIEAHHPIKGMRLHMAADGSGRLYSVVFDDSATRGYISAYRNGQRGHQIELGRHGSFMEAAEACSKHSAWLMEQAGRAA